MAKAKHDWHKLDPLIDNLKAQGWNDTQISKDLRIGRQTLVDHLRSREPIGTLIEHQGTLEGHQEMMKDIQQSVPEVAHIITEAYQSVPQQPDIPEREHPSTPEVHRNLSTDDSGVPMEHSGVPARQEHLISTPIVHPGTPTEEDWELWTTIKAMWPRVEKMLSDQEILLGTPVGTPRQTQKKTYIFDVQHIAMIEEYARVHRLELKDVIYTMCEEFFQRR